MASDSSFDSPTESVAGTIPAAVLQALTAGNHTVYVRGQDSAGNWGAYNLVILSATTLLPWLGLGESVSAEVAGPALSALRITRL